MSHPEIVSLYDVIANIGVVPLFYNSDLAVSQDILSACVTAGAYVVEFTNRGEQAVSVFSELSAIARVAMPQLTLGIGSVVDATTAALFIGQGAKFVVSPYLCEEVAKLCTAHDVPYIPGAFTPTEIATAQARGADIVKLFPAGAAGPEMLRQLLGPTPRSRLMPTGGIAAAKESVTGWIEAGAVALGMGSQLINMRDLKPSGMGQLTRRIAEVREWIAAARSDRGKRA